MAERTKYVITPATDDKDTLNGFGILLRDYNNDAILPRTHKDLVVGLATALDELQAQISKGELAISTGSGNVLTGVSLSTDSNNTQLIFTAGTAYTLAHTGKEVEANAEGTSFSKFTVDDEGHITGTADVTAADLKNLVFGTDTEKFASENYVSDKVSKEVAKVATAAVTYRGPITMAQLLGGTEGVEKVTATNGDLFIWNGDTAKIPTVGSTESLVERGDYILAYKGEGASTVSWYIIEKNLDGAVTVTAGTDGPTSIDEGEIVVGATGQLIKGSGVNISVLKNLGENGLVLTSAPADTELYKKTVPIFIGTGKEVANSGVALNSLVYIGSAGEGDAIGSSERTGQLCTVLVENNGTHTLIPFTFSSNSVIDDSVKATAGESGHAGFMTKEQATNLANAVNKVQGDGETKSSSSRIKAEILETDTANTTGKTIKIDLAAIHEGSAVDDWNKDPYKDKSDKFTLLTFADSKDKAVGKFSVSYPTIDVYGRVTGKNTLSFRLPVLPAVNLVKQAAISTGTSEAEPNTNTYSIVARGDGASDNDGVLYTDSVKVDAFGNVYANTFTGTKGLNSFVIKNGTEAYSVENDVAITIKDGKFAVASKIAEAGKVTGTFTLGNIPYNGSGDVSISIGDGLKVEGNDISVDPGTGLTIESNKLALATIASTTSSFELADSAKSGLSFALPTINVDEYGRVTLGTAKEFTVSGTVGQIKGYAIHPSSGDPSEVFTWNVGESNAMTFGDGLVISTHGNYTGIVRTALTFEYLD